VNVPTQIDGLSRRLSNVRFVRIPAAKANIAKAFSWHFTAEALAAEIGRFVSVPSEFLPLRPV